MAYSKFMAHVLNIRTKSMFSQSRKVSGWEVDVAEDTLSPPFTYKA